MRPAKSARKNPSTQYSSPGTEATNVPRETSYQAAYSGDVPSIGLHHKEQNITSAAPNVHPAGGPQHIPTALPAGGSPTPSSLHPSEAEVSKDRNVSKIVCFHDILKQKLPPVCVEEPYNVQRAHWRSYRFELQHAPP